MTVLGDAPPLESLLRTCPFVGLVAYGLSQWVLALYRKS